MALPKQFLLTKILWVVWLMLQLSINPLDAAPQASLVTSLPGFNGTFPSKHYSGYVKLDTNPAKNLFYYFVVSERNPAKDPVVLWLNGGPGCSSFDGFVYEHGPFNFEKGKKKEDLPILHLNPYSWSKVSNIIYLDSPSGVGFSYPNLPTGDLQTASDSHAFLLKWFELYPEFQANPFYLSGESYAGVYVPTLAAEVDKGIRSGASPKINFKGYLIGNGVCDDYYDGDNALASFTHGMGIISDELYKEYENGCQKDRNRLESNSDQCSDIYGKINRLLEGLNVYDILEACYHGDSTANKTGLPSSFKELGKTEKPLPVRTRMFGRAWPFGAPIGVGKLPSWSELAKSFQLKGAGVPCFDDEVATRYLNDAAVRKAIHASPEAENWAICVRLDYQTNLNSLIPYHKNLTAALGYSALIYSGDHDMCIPFTGSEAWTASLGYKIVDEWRAWISSDDQVAGYLQGYDHNLTFLTIKGAGHTVPEYKPRESLDFYDRWLQGHKI